MTCSCTAQCTGFARSHRLHLQNATTSRFFRLQNDTFLRFSANAFVEVFSFYILWLNETNAVYLHDQLLTNVNYKEQ